MVTRAVRVGGIGTSLIRVALDVLSNWIENLTDTHNLEEERSYDQAYQGYQG